ncbi:MAG: glycosyltransferase family 4 protein [Gammaproteobacteria bacterium]|nr:glycosyltransferase family 4 protein [Gammaproteobacteria bacterium]MBU2435902.1 glycosyltransferase family 4 protein [Gammaproteobacteria bacterium]MBU2449317.1 glycosyltransferase family 4 protein [Gammaproteobacteria bacterium]
MNQRILLSAFACDPVFGSDEEVGWQWARQLSDRGFDVTVITRASHQATIEAHVSKTGECQKVRFLYVDLPALHSVLRRFNRRNHLYYYVWQWAAYRVAARAHQERRFDLVHHVTWVSFRQPSFMWKLGIPFYFGPVAGGDEIPAGYTAEFSWSQRMVEVVRHIANSVVRFDPLMRLTFGRAERVFFTSEGHLNKVSPRVAKSARVELAIGCDALPLANYSEAVPRKGTRLVFVGRCIGLKGMDLGLQAFARALAADSSLTLTIIGDGVDRARWQQSAEHLGISHVVTWLGWMTKDEVLARYKDFDLLFYPSLRDSGGFVVLEALQCGLPVVCFRLGGPGVVVDDTCGAAVAAGTNVDSTLNEFADAVIRVLARVRSDPALSSACRKRVQAFGWDALIERIYGNPKYVEATV